MLINIHIFIFSIIFISSEALKCQKCSSVQSCLNAPVDTECPERSSCYSISLEGEVFHKGCVEKCTDLSFGTGTSVACAICTYDNCNGKGSIFDDGESISQRTVGQSDREKYDIEEVDDADDLKEKIIPQKFTIVARNKNLKNFKRSLEPLLLFLATLIFVCC